VRNLTPLDLSSPEKSVTIQTKNTNSERHPHFAYCHVWITSVQCNLARGRIAVLSCHHLHRQMHLSAAGAEQTESPAADAMHSSLDMLERTGTSPLLKRSPSHGGLEPHLLHNFLDPNESASQTASRSVQPLLHSSPVCLTYRLRHVQHP